MLILSSLSVDNFEYEKDILTWVLQDTTEALSNYYIDIYRSESSGGSDLTGFDLIASGISPSLYSYEVTYSGLAQHHRTWYYKLKIVNSSTLEESIVPTTAAYAQSSFTDNTAREIYRRKKLSMDRGSGKIGAGRTYYILKRRTWGQHCTECWDEDLFRATDPACSTCYGTGWVDGYFDPITVRGMANPSPKYNEILMFGDWKPSDVMFYTLRYPLLNPKDLIISEDGSRFIILQVRKIEGLGRLIEQQAQLALLGADDPLYEIGISR